MKRLVLFICTILCANVPRAQLPIGSGFYYEDIMYEVTSENEVKVCHPRSYYEGGDCPSSIEIPSVAIYHVEIPGQGTFHDEYSVTSIGEQAFYLCSSLTSIDIPNSVTSIGESAFSCCWSLTSITLPNSVTSIGDGAFSYCNGLTSITIPNSVTSIGDNAFSCCWSLTSITLPNSVTSIGEWAFSDCSVLTSITLPNSVTSIGDNAFYNCSSLTSVTIPNSITSIAKSVFFSCSGLISVTIPESVTSIARSAFGGCSFLQNVTCLATTPPTLEDNTVFPYPNITTLTVPCGSLEAYSTATSFWNMFFAGRISEDCGGESGLEDLNAVEISFFPNPTNSKVTFNQAIERIELIDLAGKTLRTYENESEINIEQLPAGVYYLRLTNNEKQTLRKLIKE
ncbi:MAG: leucine-rich repeat domain-containing protein [Bacteroidales bacterium]|nr:leucine-rich repeat domain-containing protein [Bacteroidales bacterium]